MHLEVSILNDDEVEGSEAMAAQLISSMSSCVLRPVHFLTREWMGGRMDRTTVYPNVDMCLDAYLLAIDVVHGKLICSLQKI